MRSLGHLEALQYPDNIESKPSQDKEIDNLCEECYQAMSDDFNTPQTIAALFDLGKRINAFKDHQQALNAIPKNQFETMHATFKGFTTQVLGLLAEKKDHQRDKKFAMVMQILLELRQTMKQEKNFAVADMLRNRLKEIGITIQDTKEGSTTFELDPEQED